MQTIKNQLIIQVIDSNKSNWYIKYPGFVNLISENNEKVPPFFCTGVAKIKFSKCNELNSGDHVIFIGFADSYSLEYKTSINCVVKVENNLISIPEDLGIVTQMVYAVNLLKLEAGMNIYVEPEVRYIEVLKKVIFGVGCNIYTDLNTLNIYDGAILLDGHNVDLKLTDQATVIKLDGMNIDNNCAYPGQDFDLPLYMINGTVVPDHFMYATTRKNLITAYRFLCGRNEKTEDIIWKSHISPSCFPELMRNDFEGHITPGIMSITVRKNDVETAEELSKGIAQYVLCSQVKSLSRRFAGNSVVLTLKFNNGSVADCFAISSNKDSIEAELHFDRMSLTYIKGCYWTYKGLTSTKENNETQYKLSVEDEKEFVGIGKAIKS